MLDDFADLNVSNRTREYDLYPEQSRDVCVYKYLFEGYSHRKLDEEVLSLNPTKTKGWQAMGILHHYGLIDDHKGKFEGKDIYQCIKALEEKGGDYASIAESLRRYSHYDQYDDLGLESVIVSGDKEGRKVQYYTTKYERSLKNRTDAIRIHGTTCMACGFDFEKVYGERGRGFIEVHHLKPLFSRNEEIVVNPETDLVCLCSNCHRMIHRNHDNILSIEELRDIITSKNE